MTNKEIYLYFSKYQKINRQKFNESFSKDLYYDYLNKLEFGDWFLIQHVCENTISKPILALFIGINAIDMAIEICYIPNLIPSKKLVKLGLSSIVLPELQSIIIWCDMINILGVWKSKPSISQLKQANSNKYEHRNNS